VCSKGSREKGVKGVGENLLRGRGNWRWERSFIKPPGGLSFYINNFFGELGEIWWGEMWPLLVYTKAGIGGQEITPKGEKSRGNLGGISEKKYVGGEKK